MSLSLQPGVGVSENDTGGSARTPLEMLRGVTRHVATAESLEVVLQSIAVALVEQADATNSRIFLALTDAECPVCRSRGPGGSGPAANERALHCVASAGHITEEHLPHRVSFDSSLPPAIQWRLRDPVLINDWREFELLGVDTGVLQAWHEMEIKSAAGFPLEFRGEQLGSVGFLAHRRITTEEFALLGIFADQAALAIRNAQLYRESSGIATGSS
jgi:GAF domain-containing protein